MAFKMYKCKGPLGLPLLEVPDGPFFFERLSPGEIREADYYEEFRWGKGGKMLFACPRGKSVKGRCKEPLRLLRIRHRRAGLSKLIKDCESGVLYKRREKTIRQILKDTGRNGDLQGLEVERFLPIAAIGLFVLFSLVFVS